MEPETKVTMGDLPAQSNFAILRTVLYLQFALALLTALLKYLNHAHWWMHESLGNHNLTLPVWVTHLLNLGGTVIGLCAIISFFVGPVLVLGLVFSRRLTWKDRLAEVVLEFFAEVSILAAFIFVLFI